MLQQSSAADAPSEGRHFELDGKMRQGAEARGEDKEHAGPDGEHDMLTAAEVYQRAQSQAALQADLERGRVNGHMLYAGEWGVMQKADDRQDYVKRSLANTRWQVDHATLASMCEDYFPMQGSWRSGEKGAAEFTSFDMSKGVVTFQEGARTQTCAVEKFATWQE